jgi:hypothetical protein
MKKIFLISMFTTVFLVSSSTVTFAEKSNDIKQITDVRATHSSQIMNKGITGTVEKISDKEMTVKTEDGINYSVPLDYLSKADGFDELGIIAGTKVSLKNAQFQSILIAQKSLTAEEAQKFVKDATITVPQVIRELTPDEIHKLGEGTTQGIQGIGNIEEKIIAVDENQKLLEGVTMVRLQMAGALTLDETQKFGEGITQGSDLIFIATEITANGKTVKISK